MELVYLWVEGYKNIEKQGFNFSPRFRCEYDEDTKELTIVDKDETGEFYPKNFFGDNINVTAIVGENGSGKSSLLEYLNTNNCYLYDSKTSKLINKKIDTFFLTTDDLNSKDFINEILFFSLVNKNKEFIKNNFLPNAFGINLDINVNFEFLRDFKFYKIKDRDEVLIDPETGVDEFILDDINYINEEMNNVYKKSKENILIKKNFEDFICFNHFCQILQELKENEDKEYNNIQFYELDEETSEKEFHTEIGEYIDFFIDIIYVRNKYIEDFSKEINDLVRKYNKNIDELIKKYNDMNFQTKGELIYVRFEKNLNLENILKEQNRYIGLDFLQINSKKNQIIKFRNLSKGEQDLLKIYAVIFNKLENREREDITILMDETIVYWHPNWQKEFLLRITLFYEIFFKDININTIITTHSPFLLSDLPKENIIFLEKGKQVYPFEDGKQTFGANIHTLLSHGFFMKDGLMGKFAKDKIDIAIKYLNQKVLTPIELDYCENIISIIGEPIIKRELQKMLDSKKLSEIEQIKKEIKALEERMTLIWKNSK